MLDAALIVENERPMQERLFRILGMLGYAESGISCAFGIAQAKAAASRPKIGIVLISLGLPEGGCAELIGWLRSKCRSVPILAISASESEETVFDALRAGASGYLLKERDDLEIAISLRNALKGGLPIDPFIARRILPLVLESANGSVESKSESQQTPLGRPLSKREQAVLTHVVGGMSNREIAGTLSLSQWTVDAHIRNIYRKLSVNSRTQATRVAYMHDLVQ